MTLRRTLSRAQPFIMSPPTGMSVLGLASAIGKGRHDTQEPSRSQKGRRERGMRRHHRPVCSFQSATASWILASMPLFSWGKIWGNLRSHHSHDCCFSSKLNSVLLESAVCKTITVAQRPRTASRDQVHFPAPMLHLFEGQTLEGEVIRKGAEWEFLLSFSSSG